MGAKLLGCFQIYDQTEGGEQKKLQASRRAGGRKQQQYEEDAKERLAQMITDGSTNTSLYVLLWVLGLKESPLIRAGIGSVVGCKHIFAQCLITS